MGIFHELNSAHAARQQILFRHGEDVSAVASVSVVWKGTMRSPGMQPSVRCGNGRATRVTGACAQASRGGCTAGGTRTTVEQMLSDVMVLHC